MTYSWMRVRTSCATTRNAVVKSSSCFGDSDEVDAAIISVKSR